MIIEEDYYLEHYGKVGMKWGKRTFAKARTSAYKSVAGNQRRIDARRAEKAKAIKRGTKKKSKIFDKQINRDIAQIVGATAAAAAFYYLASSAGQNMMRTSFNTVRNYTNPSVDNILRRSGNVKVSDITNFIDVTSSIGGKG